MSNPQPETARRIAAGLVVVWMSNGAIHYDLSRLPPDAEARVACCVNGPAEDGRCARDMSEVAR